MIHLSFEQEKTLIKNLLLANNVPEDDAVSLAAVVTHSDFTGTYSHGLSRLCIYLRQYIAGALIAQPEWKVIKDEGAAISYDCGGGSGIVAVNTVYDEVLKRARKYGVAAGTGSHSANIGCGGYYGHRMAEDNVIGIVMSNTYPCQAPFLGADRLIGTNPIIMGAPTSNPERPIVIDISTSGVAIGKVQAYRRENKQDHHRLHAPEDGLQRNSRNPDAQCKESEAHTVADPIIGGEQRHDIHHQHDQLGSGV